MLIESQIKIDHMNTSNGHRIIVTCEKLNFTKYIDMQNVHISKIMAIKELEKLAFTQFRCGKFRLEPEERHKKALEIIQFKNKDLIDHMYTNNFLERDIVKRELKARDLFDRDIYYMGFYGVEVSKKYAIEMLKEKELEIRKKQIKMSKEKKSDSITVRETESIVSSKLKILRAVFLRLIAIIQYCFNRKT